MAAKWLSDHFFELCLETASNVKDDGGKTAAEGHCNVGLAMEETGECHMQWVLLLGTLVITTHKFFPAEALE